MVSSQRKRRGAWDWLRVAFLIFVLSSCAQIMSFSHDVPDGACATDKDCAPDKLCLLDSCSHRCSEDADCSLLYRCLKTTRGNACVDSRAGCLQGCPSGTVCADDDTCRTTCSTAADCLKGQLCPASLCVGADTKHDPPKADAGGGAGGTNGGGGAGGAGATDAGTVDAGPPRADCDGNGTRETLLGTVDHCANCSDACKVANGTAACVDRKCEVASCSKGFDDCDKDYGTGCEADLTANRTCGSCNNACVAPTGGSASCVAGACSISACPTGFDDCDGDYKTGCETPLNTLTDCGKCKTACKVDNGAASCETGTCQIACACSASAGDGGLDASVPKPAPAPDGGDGGVDPCRPGTCASQACNKGFGDCDDLASTGCETDLTTSMNHCGACGAQCNYAHASENCVAGKCTFLQCDKGWANCDGILANGCETDLSGTPNKGNPKWIDHCGACGTNCQPNGTALCVAQGSTYVCQLNSCAATFYTTPDTNPPVCSCKIQTNVSSASTCAATPPIQIDASSTQTFTASEPDGQDDWYHFTLPGENASHAARYRVRTDVTVTAGFLMEIKDTSCTEGATLNVCPGEASNDPTAVNVWEWFDTCGSAGDPGANGANQCTNLIGGSGYLAAPTELWVRVYSQGAPMCATYDLKIERVSF